MRVVVDTNVLVSGIYFGGAPGRVVDHWLNAGFTACITPSIYEEYLRVIDRICQHTKPIVEHDWPTLLSQICQMIPDSRKSAAITRDPSDDKFILCALNANARYLITGDMDLKTLTSKYRFNFQIISPAEFVRILD